MGHVFYKQEDYAKAMENDERALAGRDRLLGPGHVSTLLTVSNMGLVSFEQGAFDIALALFERVLTDLKKSLSPDHLWTIRTVFNIARAYDTQRNYAAAMF